MKRKLQNAFDHIWTQIGRNLFSILTLIANKASIWSRIEKKLQSAFDHIQMRFGPILFGIFFQEGKLKYLKNSLKLWLYVLITLTRMIYYIYRSIIQYIFHCNTIPHLEGGICTKRQKRRKAKGFLWQIHESLYTAHSSKQPHYWCFLLHCCWAKVILHSVEYWKFLCGLDFYKLETFNKICGKLVFILFEVN